MCQLGWAMVFWMRLNFHWQTLKQETFLMWVGLMQSDEGTHRMGDRRPQAGKVRQHMASCLVQRHTEHLDLPVSTIM